ncbi:AP2-like ethylene-responsive transcription factor AIL7 [Canna indica]|uniref:AP2-like ethylene-responsive transcription factor AIL7 n=1 Tax=Canna indica TaxID=4628 RepID=A0AAQ3KU52_9LILI|nr:AP2-like ethylene-responsive transcription factor AIL7 [Canna indica]
MGHNWISFGLPPLEMLLRPCSFDLPPPSSDVIVNDCAAFAYNYQYFLPPPPAPVPAHLKLEDLLGGGCGAPPCSETLTADCQDSSSASTILVQDQYARAVEDESSAAGGDHRTGREATAPRTGMQAALVPAAAVGGQRTSIYRGVTRHRWTGRYEAHLWDNTCRREGQKRKGRQVQHDTGGYDKEEKAGRAYDLAALKYWGPSATTNFPVCNYSKEIEEMKCMTKQEFIASIRRKSSGFSRGASIYRGVTRHHQHGRWQARIGRVAGNKDLYLGTFATEEEAAEAYDVAAIKFRGANAVTNFELSRYDVEAIATTDLPIGASAKRIKQSVQAENNQLPLVKWDEEHPLNCMPLPPPFFHNLMQFHGPPGPSPELTFYSSIENDAGVCGQSMYSSAVKDQHQNQLDSKQQVGSGILQLAQLTSK